MTTEAAASDDDIEARKPGVASDGEMLNFLKQNQDVSKITIIDSRNPDFLAEPSDELYGSSNGLFPIADCGTEKRPNALNVPFDRTKKALSGSNVESILTTFEKDRAIITHCGGGGRGQKSKEWLEKEGFTNVINGGGPQVTKLWDMFGHL